MGRGPAGAALLQARSRPRSIWPSPRRRPTPGSTSPNTTSGCTTCSTPKGERLFPPKLRLLSHWNLRDEIKADYADAQNGLAKQRMIQQVMERIVTQTIPAVVVNNPERGLESVHQRGRARRGAGLRRAAQPARRADRQPASRTRATRCCSRISTPRSKADPYSPTAPTLIARRFDEDREIPEARVRAMLEQILTSPLVPQVAELIETRLGRPLEPFDIWYNGFRPRQRSTPRRSSTPWSRKKYPTAEAYQKDIPEPAVQARLLARARAVRRRQHRRRPGARLRPRHGRARCARRRRTCAPASEKNGMNYKGFNIAVHEMGHNVEQTFSLNDDRPHAAARRPNTAFTEALAFVFQGHDLELLGLPAPDADSQAEKTLNDFWATYEIAGVALVDMARLALDVRASRGHAGASSSDATVQIAKDVWNRYYAPVFHQKDVVLLGIYSHMIDSFLYLPDYPIGHMIAFQIEEQMKKAGAIGPEFERMAKMGRVTPDLWMEHATGEPVGPEALLAATQKALAARGFHTLK